MPQQAHNRMQALTFRKVESLPLFRLPQSPSHHPKSNYTMSKSKSRKRKQAVQVDMPSKIVKTTATTITPPPDGTPTPIEPKSVQSIISEEELEITLDTLSTLTKYPNLLKSKACKDLRVAVYDFRQACSTGVNSARMFLPFFPLRFVS